MTSFREKSRGVCQGDGSYDIVIGTVPLTTLCKQIFLKALAGNINGLD